ncbi:MAG: ABC transporter substrate-binding protein [Dehalococcoidia bacterium]
MQKSKGLSLVACLMMIGLIASLISGCGGGGGGGGGGGVGEKPQYGGQLNMWLAADPTYFDDALGMHAYTTGPYQCLWGGNWSKGHAGGYGTAECDWYLRGESDRYIDKAGMLAESWEIGSNYIIFHLRQGVHWQNISPVPKGRLVTADDVIYSWERQRTLSTGYVKTTYPEMNAAMSISKIDDSTVRFDCPSQYMSTLISIIDYVFIYPKDVIEMYGDMAAWDRAIGTGAFTIKEYVPSSYLDWQRNPTYWQTNPIGPGQGDQLPYLSSVKTLIVADPATADSLFTTGQIDITTADFDRAQALLAVANEKGVKYNKFIDGTVKYVIFMRMDNPDKPYGDVRVRQALQLAINNQQIVDQYFGGQAIYPYWPVYPCKEYDAAYLPLKNYPDEPVLGPESVSVKDLFGYDPDKAKQLLADAGYADGFKAEIVFWDFYLLSDVLQMVKSMWSEIGVDLTLKGVSSTEALTIQYFGSFNDMFFGGFSGDGTYFKGINYSGKGMWNASRINDPVLNNYISQMLATWPDEDATCSIHRQMLPSLVENCYVIQTAAHYTWVFWWPWLKNYSGEGAVGYYPGSSLGWIQYVWIDQALKKSMGY